MSAATAVPSAAEKILAYFRDFGVLRETRREFWGVQLVNLLDNTFYFAMLTIGALFLSHDLGMSDQAAGRVIASYTSAAVISLTFSGAVCDWLGIRRALRLSVGAMLVLRLAVVGVGLIPTLPHRGALVAVLLFLMAPFMASMNTIYQSATKRFTTQRSRSAGFNVWYLVMNLGSAAGEYSIDFVRLHLRVANVHIFTMGVVTAILCLVCIQLLMSNDAQLGPYASALPNPFFCASVAAGLPSGRNLLATCGIRASRLRMSSASAASLLDMTETATSSAVKFVISIRCTATSAPH